MTEKYKLETSHHNLIICELTKGNGYITLTKTYTHKVIFLLILFQINRYIQYVHITQSNQEIQF